MSTNDFSSRHRRTSRRLGVKFDCKLLLGNDLLENSIKGIPESGAGGHTPAAAGSIPKKYYEKFLENLERELSKFYN